MKFNHLKFQIFKEGKLFFNIFLHDEDIFQLTITSVLCLIAIIVFHTFLTFIVLWLLAFFDLLYLYPKKRKLVLDTHLKNELMFTKEKIEKNSNH